jgi:hypothetical protein
MSGDRSKFDLAKEWRDEAPPLIGRIDGVEQVRRAHRRMLIERLTGIAVPLAAIALIGAALYHASNVRERVLGALAAACVLVSWAIHMRWLRAQRHRLAAPSRQFVQATLRHRALERRIAVFLWAILAFELAFLIPWWAGGIRVHAAKPLTTIAVLTFWVPAGAIVALGAWSMRLWRRASTDLPRLRRAIAELSEEEN